MKVASRLRTKKETYVIRLKTIDGAGMIIIHLTMQLHDCRIAFWITELLIVSSYNHTLNSKADHLNN